MINAAVKCDTEPSFTRPTGPTMKLKRPVVVKMYKEQIENFYKELATPTTPDNPLPPK